MNRYDTGYLDEGELGSYHQEPQQELQIQPHQEQQNLGKEQSSLERSGPTQTVVDEEELLAAQAAAEAAAQQQQQQPDGAFGNVGQGLSGVYRDMMMQYWQETINSIEHDEHDFKNHQLPLARIKKVMKTDEDVRMISAEAPILFAKGCDVFITELTMRAWIHAEENKRRTLQKSDIAAALTKSDMFDFLIDVVPREEEKPKKSYSSLIRSSSYAAQPAPGMTSINLSIPQNARNTPSQVRMNIEDRSHKPIGDLTNQQVYQQHMLQQQFLNQPQHHQHPPQNPTSAPNQPQLPSPHITLQDKPLQSYPMGQQAGRPNPPVHQHVNNEGEFQNFNFSVYEEKF